MSYKQLYFDELANNLKTYVSNEFEVLDESSINSIPESCRACQNFLGEYSAISGVYGNQDVLKTFSTLYAKFDVEDEIVDEILADFINLHNGLVAVKLSNSNNTECTLTVPAMPPDESTHLYKNTYTIRIKFEFGDVYFFISEP